MPEYTPSPDLAKLPALAEAGRVLILDDEPINIRLLERLLAREPGLVFRSLTDSRLAAEAMVDFEPDLVLLDLHMPHLDGFAVLEMIRTMQPPGAFLPVAVLTADATPATKLRALQAGATDFLTKPLDNAEVLLRARNLLHTRRLHLELSRHNARLEDTVRLRTNDLRQALEELRAMQGHLVQQERLSAFGTMAGGVAHDFNNALSIILGYSEILLAEDERLSSPERLHHVRTIITAAKDSAGMVRRLREFYRPSGEHEVWQLVDFTQLVAEAISLTEPKWKGEAASRGLSIQVEQDLAPVRPVRGNAAELRELLTNLIFNAVDAMPGGGTIRVAAREEEEMVVVEVADSGTGMPETVRQRCLEPFFTTKGENGTGLGLAMVYGIVQRHGAAMQIDSEEGRGTTFRFQFQAEKAVCGGLEAAEVRLAHPLRILVVDDQPFICEILAQYLAQDCHQAEQISSGEAALARLRETRFDLLITDQAMPEMTGGQLASAAREADPYLKVILLTGFGKEGCPEEGNADLDLVLGKPVSLEALRHALAQVFAHDTLQPIAVT